MIIQCTSCRSKYQYDEERFERKPSKKIKCAKCQTVFEIFNPAFAAKVEEVAPGEQTFASKKIVIPPPVEPATAREPLPEANVVPSLRLPEGKRISLAILEGDGAGSVFRIEKPRVTIGRANADIVINDSEASRQHAAIEVRDGSYTLVDLGSTNGTSVGGEKISEPVELHDKGEFQVGATTLMFIVTDEI